MKDKVEEFFRLADPQWWNPNRGHDNRFWFFKAQSEYVKKQLEIHSKISQGALALDAGCGRGIYSKILADLGCTVTSFDINPKMLELTRQIVSSRLVEGSLVEMPFNDEFFEVIVSIGTSMHVCPVERMISEIYRVLKNKGFAVISISNSLSFYVLWTTRINKTLSQHQQLYNRKQFNFWMFRRMLRGFGFKILSSRGFAVIPPISLRAGWCRNIISPLMSMYFSMPFDWLLGKYIGCGVTFIVQKT